MSDPAARLEHMFDADPSDGGPSTRPRAPSWDDAHPLAAALYQASPGPDLATVLADVDPGACDAEALVEATAAWERLASWAMAGQARAVAALHRKRERAGQSAYVGDEVAACLGTTRAAGDGKVGLALGLEQLPAVGAALAAGHVDTRKATLIVDELLWLGPEHAERLADQVLPDAPRLTVPQLRSHMRRLEQSADPAAAALRHTKARGERRVEIQPSQDSMAWLSAYLPADQATAAYTALTALADAAPPDDPRCADARRADALVDVLTRYLDAGVGPDGADLPTRQRRHPHLNVTASVTTLLGLDEQPGELTGYGPIPASMVRDLASRATWTPVLVDHETGVLKHRAPVRYRPSTATTEHVVDRDITCVFPGCRVSAARCDIDHITAFDPERDAASQTVPENLQALCRHHHRLKTHGDWGVHRDSRTGRTRWVAPTGHEYHREPTPAGEAAPTPAPTTTPD